MNGKMGNKSILRSDTSFEKSCCSDLISQDIHKVPIHSILVNDSLFILTQKKLNEKIMSTEIDFPIII